MPKSFFEEFSAVGLEGSEGIGMGSTFDGVSEDEMT